MTISVAVSGASGYAGGEVLRLLAGHPDVTIGAITAHSNAGSRLGELQPHLLVSPTGSWTTPRWNLAGHDVVFLALPHGPSAAIAAAARPDDRGRSTAAPTSGSRTPPAWETFYGSAHAGTWPYGLPELPGAARRARAAPRGSRSPAATRPPSSLALAPGFAAGLARADDVVIVAASGTSGAGKAPKPHLLGAEVMGSMSPYGVGGGHRHTPEIEQNLSAAAGGPVTRLLHAHAGADAPRHPRHRAPPRPAAPGVTAGRRARGLREGLRRRAVRPPAARGPVARHRSPCTAPTRRALQVALDEHAGRVIVVAAPSTT